MDFYIGNDSGYSTGGLPTGWGGTGDVGVGPGSSGPIGSYSGGPSAYINSWTLNNYRDLTSSEYISPEQRQQLITLKSAVPSSANDSESITRPVAALNNALLAAIQASKDNYDQYNNVLKLPSTSQGLGLLPPSPYQAASSMPAGELALLQEYNKQPDVYSPDAYTGKTYTASSFAIPKIAAQSAYDAWKAQQVGLYQQAIGDWTTYTTIQDQKSKEFQDGLNAAPPKPFMPNGAPKVEQPDISPEFPKLSAYNPLKSDWKGDYKIGDLSGLFGGNKNFNPFSRLASQYDSPSFTGSGSLAQTMAKGMEGAEPQRNSSNPWQSKNLIKPASYFDESSKGIEPPKGLMSQDMITQNNVLPALQMALMGSQDNMPKGNEALDAATKPLSEAQSKGNATDKIQEARDKWKSKSLSKLANWQSLA